MKWVLMIGGALVLLVGLVALVGAMLPRAHHATRKAHYRQTPEAIYGVLAGPPDWRSDVKGFGALPDQNGRKQWWEQDKHGQKVTFELVEDSPPARRAVRIADRGLPFSGTWTFEIASAPDGGALLHGLHVEHRGFPARLGREVRRAGHDRELTYLETAPENRPPGGGFAPGTVAGQLAAFNA